MMRTGPTEVQAYFEALEPERREALGALRSHIKHLWPEAVEDFAYRMPTYHLEGKAAFAIASHKAFMVLHVIAYDLLEPFKNELLPHDHGKACIRFRSLSPEMKDLLDRIIKYVGSQIHLSTKSTRPTNSKKAGLTA